MCPACIQSYIATATLVGGIASSTGGLAAVVVKKLCLKKIKVKENSDATSERRV